MILLGSNSEGKLEGNGGSDNDDDDDDDNGDDDDNYKTISMVMRMMMRPSR